MVNFVMFTGSRHHESIFIFLGFGNHELCSVCRHRPLQILFVYVGYITIVILLYLQYQAIMSFAGLEHHELGVIYRLGTS